MRRALSWLSVAALLAAVGAAPASAAPRFEVGAWDALPIGLGVATLGAGYLVQSSIDPATVGDRSDVFVLDRWVLDGDLAGGDVANQISYATLGALLGLAVFQPAGRDEDPLTDYVLYAESLSLTLAVTTITKVTALRPRPYTYADGAGPPGTVEDTVSFFSGHNAVAFSVAGTATYLAFARDGDRTLAWITGGGAIGLATATAVLRVVAHKHFPTDVLTGAAVGGAIGVLVPWLHAVDDAPASTRRSLVVTPLGVAGIF